jgi:hypothetical protein
MTSKKSQLEIMQSAIVLMIIIFLLVVGSIFFIAQQKTFSNKKLDQLLVISQMKKSKNIALLPEVQFTADNVILSDHYDKLALLSFKKIIDENPGVYKAMFHSTKIFFDEFDYYSGWKETVVFDFAPAEFVSKKEFQIPVALTEPETYKKTVGIIHVEIYN